jgi:hypothetical protein
MMGNKYKNDAIFHGVLLNTITVYSDFIPLSCKG